MTLLFVVWLLQDFAQLLLMGICIVPDVFLMTALFMGMISAFLGYVFGGVGSGSAGWIPVLVFFVSAIVMALCGLLLKKTGWKWINDYALPICIVIGMASAIPLNMWLG